MEEKTYTISGDNGAVSASNTKNAAHENDVCRAELARVNLELHQAQTEIADLRAVIEDQTKALEKAGAELKQAQVAAQTWAQKFHLMKQSHDLRIMAEQIGQQQ